MSSMGEQNSAIVVDWRPVWWSLVWSWILIWIPSAILAVRTANTRITLGDGALTVRTGAASRSTTHVELYRVRTVAATDSIFGGGKVVLTMQDGTVHTVGPIKNADQVAGRVRAVINSDRDGRNIQYRENV